MSILRTCRPPFLAQLRHNRTVNSSFLRRNVIVLCAVLAIVLAACGGGEEIVAEEPVEDGVQTLEPAEGRDVTRDAELLEEGDVVDDAGPLPDIETELVTPRNLTIVSTLDGTIELEWDEALAGNVTGYEVLRSASGGRTDTFRVDDNSFSDAGLEDEDVFSYRVVALTETGRSELSDSITAQVGRDSDPPRRPGRPEVVENASGQLLSWSPTTDVSGIAGYIVTREIDGVVTELEAGTDTVLQDNVVAGTVVTYAVIALDGSDNRSEPSRNTTLLTGTPSDNVIVVVSAQAEAGNTFATGRLERELLERGYTISWFEDQVFDSNVTSGDDIVLLLGDVVGQGFDWNVFAHDATVIGLKSSFIQAGGFLDTLPKLDRIQQFSYDSPAGAARVVTNTTEAEPSPVVFLPLIEQIPDLEVWMTPSFSAESAIAGIIPEGGILASGREAPGCRAFYPGNTNALAETTAEGYALLVDFVEDVERFC